MGGAETTIKVPGGGWLKQGFKVASARYSRRIDVPKLGRPQATMIELGAVNHEATLAVDGKTAGTNMTSFTPSVFDVTDLVTPGSSHTITIDVKGRDAFKGADGKRTVPDAAGWSPNIPQGIFRSATLRVLPATFIADVFVRPSVAARTLTFDVWVKNTGARDEMVTVGGSLSPATSDRWAYPDVPATSVLAKARATTKVTIGPLTWQAGTESYWWPNVPYVEGYRAKLHVLTVSLRDGADELQRQVVRFGFRSTEQKKVNGVGYYFLNGVRVNFRGDNLQGANYDSIVWDGGPSDAYDTFPGFLPPSQGNGGWPQAVDNYQRLNYNVNRIHQEPASPYMLDVADEMGFMIIDESAIRGSNRDQNFRTGHDNMVAHVRALVLRDRNHPSVIRWSQDNEPTSNPADDSVQFQRDLFNAIRELDDTRPVSVDGASYGELDDPSFNGIAHYAGGLGVYTDVVVGAPDRPSGQGEFIWGHDNTVEGLAWFATSTAAMRMKDASEIRPYTLLSGWASFIPGVKTSMMRIEQGGPPHFGEENLPDPWSHPTFVRIQRAFHPLLVADKAYWTDNRKSNAQGKWPSVVTTLAAGSSVSRTLVLFNDTFAGTAVSLHWEARLDAANGTRIAAGDRALDVSLGGHVETTISFTAPAGAHELFLVVAASKNGTELFRDDGEVFTVR